MLNHFKLPDGVLESSDEIYEFMINHLVKDKEHSVFVYPCEGLIVVQLKKTVYTSNVKTLFNLRLYKQTDNVTDGNYIVECERYDEDRWKISEILQNLKESLCNRVSFSCSCSSTSTSTSVENVVDVVDFTL